MNKEIFISHSSEDKELVEEFVSLLENGVGVNPRSIFCTSTDLIPAGENFIEYIRKNVESAKIVFCIISWGFLRSKFCWCETGAAWVVCHKIIPLLVDPVKFGDVKGIFTGMQIYNINQYESLNNARDLVIGSLSEKMDIDYKKWEKERRKFMEEANKYIEERKPLSTNFDIPPNIDARVLIGSEEIFRDAIKLVSRSKEYIRVTALHEGIIKGDLRNKYIESIADRLKLGNDTNSPVELRIVSYEGIINSVINRAEIYYKRELQDFVKIRTTKFCLDIGLLLIDDTEMHLSFPSIAVDKTLRTTLVFNNAAFVKRMAGWFDNHLWNNANQIAEPFPVKPLTQPNP